MELNYFVISLGLALTICILLTLTIVAIHNIYTYIIRKKVLAIAVRSGCDVDGDIITYNKKRYYVDIYGKYVKEVR